MNPATSTPNDDAEILELTEDALESVVGGCSPEASSCGGGDSGGSAG